MSTREAGEIIHSAIGVLCREAGAPFTSRPVIRSEPGGPATPVPEPLAAITAAVALRHAAARAVADHARTAREDGRRWSQIGEAMGFSADRPSLTSVAERAFAAVASDLGRGPAFGWTCPACLQVVTDYGPELPPDQAEKDHARGCARYEAMVAAWDALWDDRRGDA